jgi:hypothetical protein
MKTSLSITCVTTERSEVSVSFNAEEFLDWFREKTTIIYDEDVIERYLVDYLNEVEYHAFYIEGEEPMEITSDLSKVLSSDFLSEFQLILDTIKYNI